MEAIPPIYYISTLLTFVTQNSTNISLYTKFVIYNLKIQHHILNYLSSCCCRIFYFSIKKKSENTKGVILEAVIRLCNTNPTKTTTVMKAGATEEYKQDFLTSGIRF